MRFTRKNISELIETVQGSPDVMGFWTSYFGGYTFTMIASTGGYIAQNINNPGHRVCEDSGHIILEDAAYNGCQ